MAKTQGPHEPLPGAWLCWAPRVSGLAVAATGLLVLATRVLGFAGLEAWLPGISSTSLLAGWACILGGIALSNRGYGGPGLLSDLLALVVGVMALGSAVVQLTSLASPLVLGDNVAMSLAGAITFLLSAGALWTSGRPGAALITHLLTGISAYVAVVALTGYLYGVPVLYAYGRPLGISWVAAVGILLLNGGIFLTRREGGLYGLLSNRSVGGIMLRRLLPLVILIPLLLGTLDELGRRQGLYGADFAGAVLVVSSIALILILLLLTAHSLDRVDQARREALERALRAEAQAQKTLQDRQRLVSMICHDLKSPLTTVVMTIELLTRRLPGAREDLDRIRRASERIDRLVRDLQDYNRVSAGQLTLDRQLNSLPALCEEAMDAIEPQAKQKGLQLTCRCDAGLPLVPVDRHRLLQVLGNLLSNAVKFTPGGGHVALTATSAGNEVRLTVQDSGPGIRPEDRPHIFDWFWQAPQTAHLGSGLGLAIARSIVEAHGGRIQVDTPAGGGTAFEVLLPVPISRHRPAERKSA